MSRLYAMLAGLLLGLALFALGLGATGMVFIDHYQQYLGVFLKGARSG